VARVLVIGRNGMLARAMRRALAIAGHEVRAVGRTEHDVRVRGADLALDAVDAVVNAAGLTNRRIADGGSAEDARLVNSLFPRLLADRCQAAGIPLVHVSTDCVFDGARGGHVESDPPDATDLYGRSKALGEPPNALVLRTSIVGPETRPGDSLLCWFLAQEHTCRGYDHHLWNGLTTLELGRVIAHLVGRGGLGHGIRHVFGEDQSKRQVLEAFRAAFAHDVRIDPTADGPIRDMRLATEHPDFLAGLRIRPFAEQLAELRPVMDRRGIWRPDLSP
jgi:dTDP-4-dehydrorhamnose reductase